MLQDRTLGLELRFQRTILLQLWPSSVRIVLYYFSFYQSIGAPDFTLNVIRNGYRLPFVNFPDYVILPNNRSARDHSSFVGEALLELLSSGGVIQVVDAPFGRQSVICIRLA